jgi:flagella basal body P-ring formation protein FlgA
MIKIIGTLLLALIAFNEVSASTKLEQSIQRLLIERGAPQYPDSEIEIDIHSIKLLPFSDIEKVTLNHVDKINKSFGGAIQYHHKNKQLSKNISGKYREFLIVPTLNKIIKKGKIIQDDDIELMRVNVLEIKKNPLINKGDILGKTPRSTIMPKNTIAATEIIEPILVEKGKIISLNYDNNQISIKMPVQALESGSMGDVIKVKNLKSNVILNVVISGKSTAVAYIPRG